MSAFDVRVGKFGTLSVTAPYNTKFISEAKELGGRWSPTERTWNFTPSAAGELGRAMKKIFNFEHPLLAGPVQTKPLTVEEIDALYEELKVVADEAQKESVADDDDPTVEAAAEAVEAAAEAVDAATEAVEEQAPNADELILVAKEAIEKAYVDIIDPDPERFLVQTEEFWGAESTILIHRVCGNSLSQPWEATLRLGWPLDGGNRMWYQIIIEPSEGYAHTYECSGEHGATPNCERDENYQYDYMIMDMAPGPTLKRFRSEFSGWTLGELYQPGEVRVCKGLSLPEYGFTKSGGWLYFGMLERTRRGRKPKVKA